MSSTTKTRVKSSLLFLIMLILLCTNPLFAESEPNNQCNQANIASLTTVNNGQLNDTSDKDDFWEFTPSSDGHVEITSEDFTGDMNGWLSDDNCSHVYDYDNIYVNNISLSADVLAGHTYKIHLKANSGSSSYKLIIDFKKTNTCPNPADFQISVDANNKPVTYNVHGNLQIIGNSSVCADNNKDGTCENPGNKRNNKIYMINADVDNNATTFNSSSALLELPPNAKVLWAGLQWQGMLYKGSNTDKNKAGNIKIRHPKMTQNTYEPINTNASTYKYNWVYYNADRYYYQAKIDITEYVKAGGAGWYTVADLYTATGPELISTGKKLNGLPDGGSYGAWSIVVVYEDGTSLKNLTVYDGYVGIVTKNDKKSAEKYATTHNCPHSGVDNTMDIVLDGFLTPKSGSVDSTLLMFAGEGDIGAKGDHLKLTNPSGTSINIFNNKNPKNDILNASITKNGAHLGNSELNPFYGTNHLGIDIDTFNVSNIIGNEQSQTTATFDTNGDGYHPGILAFSIQLYEPKLCYDYSYSQYGQYFTEDYNSTTSPILTGNVDVNKSMQVKLYIRNNELSDVIMSNISASILDINTTQMKYEADTMQAVYPGETFQTHILDNNFTISSNSLLKEQNLTDIIIAEPIEAQEQFYMYYKLLPKKEDINTPITVNITYDLEIAGVTLEHLPSKSLSDLDICAPKFSYTPAKGIFNIIDKNYYNTSNKYYNIPTQITKKPSNNFKIISLDPHNLDTIKDLNITTPIAVELIDASAFHDINASCEEESSSITPKKWIVFEKDYNIIDFPVDESTFKVAKKNVAFRISYILANEGGDLLNLSTGTNSAGKPTYTITNYNTTTGTCKVDMGTGQNNVSQNCSVDMTIDQLANCNKCIYGTYVKKICSRDNFAIRPEALQITFNDQNQTNSSAKLKIAENHTKNLSEKKSMRIASGYDYDFNMIATNYDFNGTLASLTPANGYTQRFKEGTDTNISYNWNPSSTVTCNDTSNKSLDLRTINGGKDLNSSLPQVGEYKLTAIDSSWTRYDKDQKYMGHHTGSNFKYKNIPDCTIGSTISRTLNSALTNGCLIGSEHNSTTGIYYKDINVTVKPYKFAIPSFITPSFRYMADVDDNASNIMAIQYNGEIQAQGEDGSVPNNYVDGCYADDINISFDGNIDLNTTSYKVRFIDYNSSKVVQSDFTKDINNSINNNFDDLNISRAFFRRDNNGIMDINVSINYNRNLTVPVNPLIVKYRRVDVNCSVASDCQISADLKTDYNITGSDDFTDANITHYYGRAHAPDYEFDGGEGNATVYYEVYCEDCDHNKFNVSNTESVDSINWFNNTLHTNNTFGDYNESTPTANDGTIVAPQNFTIMNLKTPAGKLPHKDKIDMNASNWLIYNRFDSTATRNNFEVKFLDKTDQWAGSGNLNETIDLNVSTIQNRRLDW